MDTNDIRKQSLATKAKWVLGMITAALVSPFIYLVIKGIVGLAIAAILGLLIVNFAPVVATVFANWKMKAMVAAVSANPIETMKNLFAEKSEELQQADQNIVDFETEIANYDDQMRVFKQDYPDKAPKYQEISDRMHEGLAEMKEEQKAARTELVAFQKKIREAEAIYKMSLAAAKVTQFSKSAEAQVYQNIKQQVAFDTVQSNLNRSFAQLNMALNKRSEHAALTLPTTPESSEYVAPKSMGPRKAVAQ